MKFLLLILSVLIWDQNTFASEDSVYDFSWLDKDKEVYVLQNRKFRKKNSFYISGSFGPTTSGAFLDATSAQFRAGFFFREEWGIELVMAQNNSSPNATFENSFKASSVAFFRQIDSYSGGMLMWSPFYSKINTFNKIIYYDFIIGLGFANIDSSDNRIGVAGNDKEGELTPTSTNGIMWDVGVRIYLDESWSARVDMTALHYKADGGYKNGGSTTIEADQNWSNYDLTFGVNYAF